MQHEAIRGNKVLLREQREEDAPFFAYWFNQPQIMFQCGFEKPTDEEEEKRIIILGRNKKYEIICNFMYIKRLQRVENMK